MTGHIEGRHIRPCLTAVTAPERTPYINLSAQIIARWWIRAKSVRPMLDCRCCCCIDIDTWSGPPWTIGWVTGWCVRLISQRWRSSARWYAHTDGSCDDACFPHRYQLLKQPSILCFDFTSRITPPFMPLTLILQSIAQAVEFT